jgi:lipopolysaccharide/colanic/teichoic acid biosynthesis glycosyltransferase
MKELPSKRVFDVIVSAVGLLLALPLFALIAIAIKLDSPGPVFFRQVRIGRGRQPFRMWKFRKMPDDLPVQGPMLTMRYDTRLTRVGAFLERTKLDELPQLLNVLHGQMSIVGPRPEVPKFVEHYPELWDQVLTVRPGIFGPSQLRGRNESELFPPDVADVEDFYVRKILPGKLRSDAGYARAPGLFSDVWLVAVGVMAVFFGVFTRSTVVTRGRQLAAFVALSTIGVLGMALAMVATGTPLDSRLALDALLLSAVFKPLFLLLLRIPRSLPTAISADEFQSALWCAIGSTSAIVFGMFWLGHGTMGRLIPLLDTGFFLFALILYRLLFYALHFTFVIQKSRALTRQLVWGSLFLAPLCMAAAQTLQHGWVPWSGDPRAQVPLVMLAALIRPATMLLLPIPLRSLSGGELSLAALGRLGVATLAGSGLIVLGSFLLNLRSFSPQGILLDAALFSLALTALAHIQGRKLHDRVQGSGARRRLVVIGADIELEACLHILSTLPEHHYEVAGILTPHERHRRSRVGGIPVIAELRDLRETLDTFRIDTVVLLPSHLDPANLEFIQEASRERGCRVVPMNLLADVISPIVEPPWTPIVARGSQEPR